jgi:hypothetical protein
MIRLFTSFYPESNPTRQQEILECLERNLALDEIDEVCLLLENTDPPLEHPKLITKAVTKRPLYQDLFGWTRDRQAEQTDLCIICNSDIYFDASISVLPKHLNANACVALTRWDIQADGTSRLFHRNDTQDSWIFTGNIKDVGDNYPIGVPRCDNRVLHELRQAGYAVINPAFSVKSYHLHIGQREEYVQSNLTNFVDPPYAYLWPHNLCSWPSTCMHNLLNSGTTIGWRFDWQRLRKSLPGRLISKIGRMVNPKV